MTECKESHNNNGTMTEEDARMIKKKEELIENAKLSHEVVVEDDDADKDESEKMDQQTNTTITVAANTTKQPDPLAPITVSSTNIIDISPDDALQFSLSDDESRCTMTLRHTNKTESHIAFRIQTRQPKRYRIWPKKGILSPGMSETVTILLNEKDKQVLLQSYDQVDQSVLVHSEDMFRVQTFAVTDELAQDYETDKEKINDNDSEAGAKIGKNLTQLLTEMWGNVCSHTEVFNKELQIRHLVPAKPVYALDVSPDDVLQFELSNSDDTSRCTITLQHTNKTESHIAFNVKAPLLCDYIVHPHQGILSPGKSETVTIFLDENAKQVLLQSIDRLGQSSLVQDKVVVQSCVVSDEFVQNYETGKEKENNGSEDATKIGKNLTEFLTNICCVFSNEYTQDYGAGKEKDNNGSEDGTKIVKNGTETLTKIWNSPDSRSWTEIFNKELEVRNVIAHGVTSTFQLKSWIERSIGDDYSVMKVKGFLGNYFKEGLGSIDELMSYLKELNLKHDVVFFGNLQHFKKVRHAMDKAMISVVQLEVDIAPFDNTKMSDGLYNPEMQQQLPDGSVVSSFEDLYVAAELARKEFVALASKITKACGVPISVAPLKGRERAEQKANDEYSKRVPGPSMSWLFDIVRGKAVCSKSEEISALWKAIDDENIVVRVKNRCLKPNFNGYRDLLLNLRIPFDNAFHVCEMQIHLAPIVEVEKQLDSHIAYEYFRTYFCGNIDAVQKRLSVLLKYGGNAKTAAEMVEGVMDSDVETLQEVIDLMELLCEFTLVEKLKRRKLEVSEDNEEKAVALNNLAISLQYQGMYDEALPLYEEALEMVKKQYGEIHNTVAIQYVNIGELLRDQKKFDEAMPMNQKALVILKRLYGEDGALVASAYNSMGVLLMEQGKYNKAKPFYAKALAIRKKIHGEYHPHVSSSYNNLAVLLQNQGNYNEAKAHYYRALDIDKRLFGETHPNVAITYNNIALLLYDQNNDSLKAVEMGKKSLTIFEETKAM